MSLPDSTDPSIFFQTRYCRDSRYLHASISKPGWRGAGSTVQKSLVKEGQTLDGDGARARARTSGCIYYKPAIGLLPLSQTKVSWTSCPKTGAHWAAPAFRIQQGGSILNSWEIQREVLPSSWIEITLRLMRDPSWKGLNSLNSKEPWCYVAFAKLLQRLGTHHSPEHLLSSSVRTQLFLTHPGEPSKPIHPQQSMPKLFPRGRKPAKNQAC